MLINSDAAGQARSPGRSSAATSSRPAPEPSGAQPELIPEPGRQLHRPAHGVRDPVVAVRRGGAGRLGGPGPPRAARPGGGARPRRPDSPGAGEAEPARPTRPARRDRCRPAVPAAATPAGPGLAGGKRRPTCTARIEDYALIGDLQTAALVGRDGSDRLAVPAPLRLRRLLRRAARRRGQRPLAASPRRARTPAPGAPTAATPSSWRPLGDPRPAPSGSSTSCRSATARPMSCGSSRALSGTRRRCAASCGCASTTAAIVPWMRRADGHRVAVAGPDSVWLRSEPRGARPTARTSAPAPTSPSRRASGSRSSLTWHPSHEPRPRPRRPVRGAAAQPRRLGSSGRRAARYDGPYRDAVLRSLITLKALTYAPDRRHRRGPHHLAARGDRRRAQLGLPLLLAARRHAHPERAALRPATWRRPRAWRDWLLRAVAGDPADLQIMYGLAGRAAAARVRAAVAARLRATPPRSGSATPPSDQLQLDVYGEVHRLALPGPRTAGLPDEPHAWSLQRALMDFLESTWREPDEGLWEVRGPRRHFVHSKVMAWVAADRAVRTMEADPKLRRRRWTRWRAMRDEVHREVCEQRLRRRARNTFTQSYGSPRAGRGDAADPPGRLPAAATTRGSSARSTRSRGELDARTASSAATAPTGGRVDGLPGGEGAFLACSFWLADALHADRPAAGGPRAVRAAAGAAQRRGAARRGVRPGRPAASSGNFPQAFSHIGLVSTALALSGTGQRQDRGHGSWTEGPGVHRHRRHPWAGLRRRPRAGRRRREGGHHRARRGERGRGGRRARPERASGVAADNADPDAAGPAGRRRPGALRRASTAS